MVDIATIKDIAQICSVSITTVSRVLNYDETLSVSDETRKKIFETAEELSYDTKINRSRKRIFKLGMYYSYSLEDELTDTFYLSIRVAMEKHIKEKKIKTLRVTKKDSPISVKGLDGIICLGVFFDKDIERIASFEKPTVFVDSSPNEEIFDSVIIDYKKATITAIEYFVNLGHKKIGLIGGADKDYDGNLILDKRQYYFRKYLEKQNLYNEDYVKIGNYTTEDGYILAKELLSKKEDKPSALFVANDAIAIGVYRACNELGLNIPNDVNIIGFNDISQAKYLTPPLSTVKLYTDAMGEAAIDLMENRLLTHREICRKIIIPTKLIIRESTFLLK